MKRNLRLSIRKTNKDNVTLAPLTSNLLNELPTDIEKVNTSKISIKEPDFFIIDGDFGPTKSFQDYWEDGE